MTVMIYWKTQNKEAKAKQSKNKIILQIHLI